MRVIAAGFVGLLAFWVCWDLAQIVILGPDRLDLYPAPTLAGWYFRWLLEMACGMTIAAILAGLLMRATWRLLTRVSR